MKKIIFFLLLLATIQSASACDICGSGSGGSYIGILPDFHKHVAGLRYRSNSMLTHIGVGGSTTYLTTRETFRTLEAWGGWNISPRFRLMASLPYSFNERKNETERSAKNGLGDATLSGYYRLLSNDKSIGTKLLTQSLWIGGGVKLATGRYNPSDKASAESSLNLFQLGTGSTDFILSAMYDIRLQNVGVNLASAYKVNNANRYDYEYGNKFNLSAQAYYKVSLGDALMITPNAGVQYENGSHDIDHGFSVMASGGNLLLGTVGAEAAFGKIAIGASLQTPLTQRLASGMAKAEHRLMMHMAMAL